MTRAPRQAAFLIACSALALLVSACSERRAQPQPAPVYRGDIEQLLADRCARCHGGDAAAGYRLESYLDVLSCPGDAGTSPATASADGGFALLSVLDREDHAGLLNDRERARLSAWLASGAPLREARVHPPGMLNPGSPDWHGRLAARDRFARLLDPAHPEACGRCHDGAPVRPLKVTFPAAEAPSCTQCHAARGGVLACGTCHGDGAERGAPPRDHCWFAGPDADAHRAHLESTRLRSAPLTCSGCHPAANAQLRGTHANGHVDIQLDPTLAGGDAGFDPETARCAVSCHNLGGARARPGFHESGPLGCDDCQGAPPADHYVGECDHCHVEASADGRALHMNGRIDVGIGPGTGCAACHGAGDDPMPLTPGHILHRSTTLTAAIECGECHTLPAEVGSPGHLDRGEITPADVVFGPRARAFRQLPDYRAGVCRNVACHGAGVGEGIERALRWDEPSAHDCSGCHGLPSAPPHPQDATCSAVICHGTEVRAGSPPRISQPGVQLHIDGTIDLAPRK